MQLLGIGDCSESGLQAVLDWAALALAVEIELVADAAADNLVVGLDIEGRHSVGDIAVAAAAVAADIAVAVGDIVQKRTVAMDEIAAAAAEKTSDLWMDRESCSDHNRAGAMTRP